MTDRMDRISEQMKREISVILQSQVTDPRVSHVTVTKIEVSRDLRAAKVYCVISVEDKEKANVMKGLKSASKYIRTELARKVAMKYLPKLSFIEDSGERENRSIDAIFAKLENEKANAGARGKQDYAPDLDKAREVLNVFQEKDDFIITAHINPEGDSIGSQIAVYHMLKGMGKNAIIVDTDEIPENLKFLTKNTEIFYEMPEDSDKYNLVMLDCPVRERAGRVVKDVRDAQFTINIDHHISNTSFGNINWVDPSASSVGEMVYHLVELAGITPGMEILEAIYTAIVTDTGLFNYDNTTKVTHEVAGKLIARGVNPKIIHEELFENRSAEEVRMLGKVLDTLTVEGGGRIASIHITRGMYEEEGIESIATDEFINFPRSVKGVDVAVFFKETVSSPGRVNVSFRSTGGIDVNIVASYFGGGGHPQAAGCLLEASLEKAREEVITEILKHMEADHE